jgi:hypothetical protein
MTLIVRSENAGLNPKKVFVQKNTIMFIQLAVEAASCNQLGAYLKVTKFI